MSKKICIFVGLKIIEIIGISGFYYLLCNIFYQTDFVGKTAPFWICGFLGFMIYISCSVVIFFVFLIISAILQKNWEWAKKISNKF